MPGPRAFSVTIALVRRFGTAAVVIVGVLLLAVSHFGLGGPRPRSARVALGSGSTHATSERKTIPTMPGGWRDLKFGMSESAVMQRVHEHRRATNLRWERSERTKLPIVRPDPGRIDDMFVDATRLHHWSIRDLDETTARVECWHQAGALVAIRVTGRGLPDHFLTKMTEAYATPPQRANIVFFDERSKVEEALEVAFWRGDDMTAFLWTSGTTPILLLWSIAPMEALGAEYQARIDALRE